MISLSVETNTEELKKYMNVKTAVNVHTEKNAVNVSTETGQPDLTEN